MRETKSKNTAGLVPLKSGDNSERARAIRSAGGKARSAKIRERKTIADALRAVLAEQVPNSELTKQEFIIAKALTNLAHDPQMRDIKILAEILGELKVNAENSGAVNLNITTTATSANLIQQIVDGKESKESKEDNE